MSINDTVTHRIFSCSGKVKLSHEQAKQKAKEYGLYYYYCKHCKQYHLTKQPTYDSIMESEE